MIRLLLILFGVAALVAFAAILLFPTEAWDGRHALTVDVTVFDSDELGPVSDARVTIFEGAFSPLDSPIASRHHSDFEADEKSQQTKTARTDTKGKCTFSYEFPAGGREGLFEHSGGVFTERTWIRVSAPGRPIVLVPVDRQSIRGRDIKDTTPIFVTVVMNKKVADAAGLKPPG